MRDAMTQDRKCF